MLFFSFRYDICGKTKYCNFCYKAVLVLFILVAGLRWRLGTDTPSYIYHFYHDIPLLDKLTEEELGFGAKPLWNLLNSLVKTLGGKYYIVQLIESAFVNVLVFCYIKKHSHYIFTCLFFYYLTMYFSLNMEVMKAAMSIVVCFYANDYVLQKRWVKAYFLYIIAVLFHPQVIIIMLMPLFLKLRFNWLGTVGLVMLFFIGHIIQEKFGDYLMLFELEDSISDKAEDLAESERYLGQEHSQVFMLKSIYIYIVYGCICLWYMKRHTMSKVLQFEPFVIFYVGFYVLAVNVYISYRFSMYYAIYLVLIISEMFVDVIKNTPKLFLGLSYIRSFAIVLPFVLLVGQHLVSKSFRYYPYSSVINRTVDKYREQRGKKARPNWPVASEKEY